MDMEKKVKKTKNQIENDSHRKIYERIALVSRREFCIIRRIEQAAQACNKSKNAYIIDAVEAALSADGYGRDTLQGVADVADVADVVEDQDQGDHVQSVTWHV